MPELSMTELAELTGMSRRTIARRLDQYGFQQSKTYDTAKSLAAIYSFETSSFKMDRLTKTQLATVSGYSINTVTERLEESLVIPNDEGQYITKDALAAIFQGENTDDSEQASDPEGEAEYTRSLNTKQSYETYRTEYMRAKAEREQLTLDKERGRYLIAEDVKERVSTLFRNVRTRLLAIPQRLTQTLAPDDTPKTIEKKVSHEIETALNELTRLKL